MATHSCGCVCAQCLYVFKWSNMCSCLCTDAADSALISAPTHACLMECVQLSLHRCRLDTCVFTAVLWAADPAPVSAPTHAFYGSVVSSWPCTSVSPDTCVFTAVFFAADSAPVSAPTHACLLQCCEQLTLHRCQPRHEPINPWPPFSHHLAQTLKPTLQPFLSLTWAYFFRLQLSKWNELEQELISKEIKNCYV